MRACIGKSHQFFLNLANRHPSVALVPFPDRSTATEKALVIHMDDLSAMERLVGKHVVNAGQVVRLKRIRIQVNVFVSISRLASADPFGFHFAALHPP